jgi:hypothetical protein
MTIFEIVFSFNNKTYKASVYRVTGNPVQYLVSPERPTDLKISDPFVITANVNTGQIEYGFHDEPHILGHTIASAVKKYCYENSIPLLKD